MEEYYKNGFNEYGMRVDVLLASDPIKPYHLIRSIHSLKEIDELKKAMDSNTNMNGIGKLDDLNYEYDYNPSIKNKVKRKLLLKKKINIKNTNN